MPSRPDCRVVEVEHGVLAIEEVADVGKRGLPAAGIDGAVVDRPDQIGEPLSVVGPDARVHPQSSPLVRQS